MTGEESKVHIIEDSPPIKTKKQIMLITTKNVPITYPVLTCSFDSIEIRTMRVMETNNKKNKKSTNPFSANGVACLQC